jgi:NADH-quinone oxidoreductase subunit C
VSYETDSRRVVYNKVKLTQDYRDFDFNSPWGAEDTIEDEKKND